MEITYFIVLISLVILIYYFKKSKTSRKIEEEKTKPFWVNYYRAIGFFIGLIMGILVTGVLNDTFIPGLTPIILQPAGIIFYVSIIILCVWATPKLMLKLREKTE